MNLGVDFKPVSLLERIKQAESDKELQDLLQEGAGYEYASHKTRGRWEKAVVARKRTLVEPKGKNGKTQK